MDGRRMPYHKGTKVDPADVMPDGRQFANIDEFKQLLLKDKDQLARALAEKLLTYATGARADAGRPSREIEAIVATRPRARTTASGRSSTRSCRASCFRHK